MLCSPTAVISQSAPVTEQNQSPLGLQRNTGGAAGGKLELADVCPINHCSFSLCGAQTDLPAATQSSRLSSVDYPQPQRFPFKFMKTTVALERTMHLGTGRRVREAASVEEKKIPKKKKSVDFSMYFLLSSEHEEILRPNWITKKMHIELGDWIPHL